MHVGWSAVFAVPDGGARPTLAALRERVAERLDRAAWCRWRLEPAPFGLGEPRWVDDPGFDLAAHVQALSEPDEPVSGAGFAALRDEMLSAPLDRARPMWRIFLVPRLEDGRVGLIGKIHHALVDGIAARHYAGAHRCRWTRFNVELEAQPGSGSTNPPSGNAPSGGLGEAFVERQHAARSRVAGREQDAAVGELEPGVGAQGREIAGCTGCQRDLLDLERRDRRTRVVHAAQSRRPDGHLGQRERAGAERLTGGVEQPLDRLLVKRVPRVQMRDQDAGVDDDHAGQSSRSRSR
jgi:hypothetical protein